MLDKIKFFLKKPRLIMVAGSGRATAAKAISRVLKSCLKQEVMVYQVDASRMKEAEFLLKNAKSIVFTATHAGEYSPDKEFFSAEKLKTEFIEDLVKILPAQSKIILNFDDETIRAIKNQTSHNILTFGFGARADIRATDIFLTQAPNFGTNFKINYQGNIVPVWLGELFGKEHIYAALAGIAAGEVSGLNLVEISNALKSYQGLPGRMKLVKGIKNTLILDDSESAMPLSMMEGLDVLEKIETNGRKIAVLGDIINVGKYALEAHESIGQKIKGSADLLFTVGPRAKFYAEGAKTKGFAGDKIFSFNEAGEAGLALQKEMKEGDLILVDGSAEIQMSKVVEEVKEI